jgi:hypothetical protein
MYCPNGTAKHRGRPPADRRRRQSHLYPRYRRPRGALAHSFSEMLSVIPDLLQKTSSPVITLKTDSNPSYAKPVKDQARKCAQKLQKTIIHERLPDALPQDIKSPLFSANYYRRELRKDIACFRKDGTCMSRNVSAAMLRLANYLVWHNYVKPYRFKHADKAKIVHAQKAGVDQKAMEKNLEHLFKIRSMISHQRLSLDLKKIWMREYLTPQKEKEEYIAHFSEAGKMQDSGD